jgi:hypothetical protein
MRLAAKERLRPPRRRILGRASLAIRPPLIMKTPPTTPRGRLIMNVSVSCGYVAGGSYVQFNASDNSRPIQGFLPVRRKCEVDLNPPKVRHERDCEQDRKVGIEPQLWRSVVEPLGLETKGSKRIRTYSAALFSSTRVSHTKKAMTSATDIKRGASTPADCQGETDPVVKA